MRHAATQLDSLPRCRQHDSRWEPRQDSQVRTYWWQNYQRNWAPKPIDEQSLDWKMWLGSAPDQPFSLDKFDQWRWYWNFGGGALTDLFTHWIDVVHWAMKV